MTLSLTDPCASNPPLLIKTKIALKEPTASSWL